MTIYTIYLITFQILISLVVIKFSKRLNLLDNPDSRKTHKKAVPYTGGVILSITFLFLVFITNYENNFLNILLCYSLLITLSGYMDDRYKINTGTKVLLQIIPIFLVINNGFYLTDLGQYEYYDKLKLGSFDKIFTLLCCLFIINSSNYSDGIDSLLSIIGIIIISYFAFLLFIFNRIDYSSYLIMIVITLIIHSFFNFGLLKNYKLFLGDSGSNLIGFIISFIAIDLYMSENIHPVLIIWPLAYLVFEFLSVNIIRIIEKKAIFKPGKDHFHYQLSKYFKINDVLAVIIISIINIKFSIIGLMIYKNFIPDISIISYFIFFIIFFLIKYKIYLDIKKIYL
jgi:UDP-GlcNAc:undecaprenyl-phosphate GlcNAc-1-phosphate transferase